MVVVSAKRACCHQSPFNTSFPSPHVILALLRPAREGFEDLTLRRVDRGAPRAFFFQQRLRRTSGTA